MARLQPAATAFPLSSGVSFSGQRSSSRRTLTPGPGSQALKVTFPPLSDVMKARAVPGMVLYAVEYPCPRLAAGAEMPV